MTELYNYKLFKSFKVLFDRITTSNLFIQTGVIYLLTIVLAFPWFYEFITICVKNTDIHPHWTLILEQAKHPFLIIDHPPESHQAKMQFRLFVPLLAKLLNLGVLGIYFVQHLLGIVSIYVFLFILNKDESTYSSTAFVFTSGIFATYAGACAFLDINAFFDSFALFFLLAAILFRRNYLLYGLFVFTSFWVDERALLSSAFALIATLILDNRATYLGFKHLLNKRFQIQFATHLITFLAYFILRYYLTVEHGFPNHFEKVGLSAFRDSIANIGIGLWSGIEAYWLFIIFGALILFMDNKLLFLFIGFPFALVVVAALSVHDITRSLAYLLPVFPLLYVYVQKHALKAKFNSVINYVALFSLIGPNVFVALYTHYYPNVFLYTFLKVLIVKDKILILPNDYCP